MLDGSSLLRAAQKCHQVRRTRREKEVLRQFSNVVQSNYTRCCVLNASSPLGTSLVGELLSRGHTVSALVPRIDDARDLDGLLAFRDKQLIGNPSLDVYEVNHRHPDSYHAPLEGCEVVFTTPPVGFINFPGSMKASDGSVRHQELGCTDTEGAHVTALHGLLLSAALSPAAKKVVMCHRMPAALTQLSLSPDSTLHIRAHPWFDKHTCGPALTLREHGELAVSCVALMTDDCD